MSDQTIDINSLADDLPEQEIEAGNSVYDQPPPLPDAVYTAQLQPVPLDKWSKSKSKQGAEFLYTTASYKIVDPQPESQADGRVVFDTVNTLVFDRSKTSGVMSVVAATGAQLPRAASPLQQAKLLVEVSQGTPLVALETQWEAFAQRDVTDDGGATKKEVFRKKGMRNFPKNGDGSFNPYVDAPWGEQVMAQARVKAVRVIPSA